MTSRPSGVQYTYPGWVQKWVKLGVNLWLKDQMWVDTHDPNIPESGISPLANTPRDPKGASDTPMGTMGGSPGGVPRPPK